MDDSEYAQRLTYLEEGKIPESLRQRQKYFWKQITTRRFCVKTQEHSTAHLRQLMISCEIETVAGNQKVW